MSYQLLWGGLHNPGLLRFFDKRIGNVKERKQRTIVQLNAFLNSLLAIRGDL